MGFRSIAWNEALGRSAVTLTDKIWTRLCVAVRGKIFFSSPLYYYFSSLQTCRFEVGVNGIPPVFPARFLKGDVLIERSRLRSRTVFIVV